jgi:hypothetical protein
MFASPPRDPVLWDHGSRIVLGEAIELAFMRFLPTVTNSLYDRGVAVTYTLLGDPATRVSIGRPESIVYANDAVVTDGQPVRLHTPGDTLSLVADLVSTARLDSISLYVNAGGPDTLLVPSRYTLVPGVPRHRGWRRGIVRWPALPAHVPDAPARAIAPLPAARGGPRRARDHVHRRVLARRDAPRGRQVHHRRRRRLAHREPVRELLVSPAPLDPHADVTITINGVAQDFTPTAASGDASGREWILSWIHEPYAKGSYVVAITVKGVTTLTRRFTVSTTGELRIVNLFAFPNPFDDGTESTYQGTAFSYQLQGSDPADVRISVYTISGRRIWSQDYLRPGAGLPPGAVEWQGRGG